MKTIKSILIHDRPREKLFKYGVSRLSDSELWALILRSGKKGKSSLVLADEITKLIRSSNYKILTQDLLKIDGIGKAKACEIIATIELGKRMHSDTAPYIIENTKDVITCLHDIRSKMKEFFIALFLDARNQLIQQETISIGTIDSSLVHPRELFEPAISCMASSIILAHNHPSGDVQPSEADLIVTKKLLEAGRILGISILDHVIVGKDSFLSLKEEGYL